MLHGMTNTFCASHCVERDQYLGVAGRGGWHDPDEMLIGNTNCSYAGERAVHCASSVPHAPICTRWLMFVGLVLAV